MAGVNDFLPFGIGGGANVITQADYNALAARTAGFSAGTAQSVQLNKVWRQSAMWAAALGGVIVSKRPDLDALDNGNLAQLSTNFLAAIYNSPTLTGVPTAPVVSLAYTSQITTGQSVADYLNNNYYTASQIAGNFATIAQFNTAQATANTANTVATNALNTANTAITTANNAITAAGNAQTSANNALNTFVQYMPNFQSANTNVRGCIQFLNGNFANYTLPSGGTWWVFYTQYDGGGRAVGVTGFLAAGGTPISSSGSQVLGWVLRIA